MFREVHRRSACKLSRTNFGLSWTDPCSWPHSKRRCRFSCQTRRKSSEHAQRGHSCTCSDCLRLMLTLEKHGRLLSMRVKQPAKGLAMFIYYGTEYLRSKSMLKQHVPI